MMGVFGNLKNSNARVRALCVVSVSLLLSALMLSGCFRPTGSSEETAEIAVDPPAIVPKPLDPKLGAIVPTVDTVQVWHGAVAEPAAPSGVSLTTAPGYGEHSATVVIPAEMNVSGPGEVVLTLKVASGMFQFWVSKKDEARNVLSDNGPRTIDLPASTRINLKVADLSQPMWVMFANASPKGVSKGVIESIEVWTGSAP